VYDDWLCDKPVAADEGTVEPLKDDKSENTLPYSAPGFPNEHCLLPVPRLRPSAQPSDNSSVMCN